MSLLTKREREVLDALKSMSIGVAAQTLEITPSAIYSCKSRVKAKVREAARVRREYHDVLYPAPSKTLTEARRRKLIKNADNTCMICLTEHEYDALEIHHDPQYGEMVVCRSCHRKKLHNKKA